MNIFENIISIMADVATIVAAIIAIITLCAAKKEQKQANEHNRKKDTLDAYNCLQEQVFDKLYTDYTPKQIEDIAAHYQKEENKNKYHILGTYIARIEHFCVGVVNGIYDGDTVYELAHGFLDKTVRKRISPMVERKFNLAEDDPYENIKKVYEMMDAETERRKNKNIER